MAKTWAELEAEETLNHRNRMVNAKTFNQLKRERERHNKRRIELSKIYRKEIYEPWVKSRRPNQTKEESDAFKKAEREKSMADVKKARADMASGKTSSLVGKAGQEGDPYAGVQGPIPKYSTQEKADESFQERYLLPISEKSPRGGTAERSMLSKSGEGIEVRKATGSKQVFKAMVQGDPTQDQVFDTKKEAEDYLARKDAEAKQKARMEIANKLSMQGKSGKEIEAYLKKNIGSFGVKGAVAGVRMTGGSGEEIKAKEAKYREQAGSSAKKEKELKALYDKRRTAAQERMDRVSKGEIGAREAGIESQIEDIAETSPKRARQFETGLQNIEDKRAAREAAITSQRIRNVAEGKAGMPFGESDRITKMENRANRRERDLRSMYEKAVNAGNFDLAMKIEDEIKSTIGTDPRSTESRRRFFKQKLSRANPF